ncbi:hypothetical protein [Candidatus Uabimicrobium sp. HlEnr_7]|uniref:hypothetical protein n=1 Tax=Candidatus Uabimicrobium helgolandensis TaxID=3095367 RepID=UPI0035577768
MSNIKVIFIFIMGCCVFANSELDIQIKTTSKAYVNDQVDCVISVSNNTNHVIKNIIVKHQVPAGFTYRGQKTGQFALKWRITSLQPKASKQFIFSLHTLSEGIFAMLTQVFVVDKLYEIRSTINVVVPKLIVEVTASSKYIFVGQQVVLKIKINNIGSGSAYNVNVLGVLDEALKCINSKPKSVKSQQDLLDNLQWKIPEIASDQEIVLEVIARGVGIDQSFPFSDKVYNGRNAYRVVVKASDKEYSDTCHVQVDGQKMYMHISTYDMADPVRLNQETVYVTMVRNEGTTITTNIIVNSNLPKQMEFVSVKGSHYIYNKNIHQVKFAKIESLQPGEKVIYKIICRVIKEEGTAKYSAYLRHDQFNRYILDEEGTSIYK